ncbi:peptidase S8/S53 domain-containing protein [Mycena rosella]|uniref:Peptidase S8/S53 domain-containing protein n=1 Tax=Mycena rosella TaxID=1033263 RepID=A0AAD7CRF7_MYCRO|nr:peptidase S8/S53 domain-containing protein [Mycena rosella]
MQKPVTFLFVLLAGVHANFLLLEKRDGPPPGFTRVGPTPLDQTLNLRLALTQNDIAGLQDTLYDISTPGNARYGQYLTQDEVNQFAAPSAGTLSQVNSWLAAQNLASSPLTPAGDWVSVNMTVSQANEMFAAEFSTFQNQDTNQTVVRTLSYSIPTTLEAGISWVHPTVNFPVVKTSSVLNLTSKAVSKRASPNGSVSADCRASSSWTPACLQEFYGIPSTPAEPAANVFGVSGFENGFANELDLKQFLETYRPDMNPNTTFDLISIDGGINNQLPGGAGIFEGADIQYAIGLTTGVPVTFISTGTLPNDVFTELLDQAQFLISMEHPPQTIVNGYQALESQVSPQFAISLCNAYAQLAARGISYIVEVGTGCTAPLDPPFPATCPFVTAVGATEFTPDETEETAAPFSNGGFSNFFKRPKYQDAAVQEYLESTGNTNSTAFNVTNRAVPDVAALNLVDFIFEGQVIDFLGGTDFSAHIFASIVALLTNERVAAGKPGLGFLNPLIYQNPSAFTDIKTGSNSGCVGVALNATAGWDPVTGVGSPIYLKLQEISSDL